MPDGLQMQGSARSHNRRPDRLASSCTECRRRKQKCSQGQPCTNCARRFPQPICDYETRTKSRRSGTSPRAADSPAAKIVSKEGPYSHLNMAGVQEAILQVENASRISGTEHVEELVPIPYDPIAPSSTGRSLHDPNSDQLPGYFMNWLPFRLTVQNRAGGRRGVQAALRAIINQREGDRNLSPEDEWQLDAAKLIMAAQQSQRSQPSYAVGRIDDEFKHLPVAPTRLNKELLRTHLRLLCRFKGSINGTPDPDNPLMRYWVPFILQDPLLMQITLFTSACFLNETGHLPKTVVAAYRGLVFQTLNDNLRSKSSQISDVAIHGVAELVLDEWYWGATKELHAHMRGLKTMIRLRGGVQHLGMHGLISKMILLHDALMALAHETLPEMYGVPGFEFVDPHMVPFQPSFSSPLIPNWPSCASFAGSLNLHPFTAAILDDCRVLFETLLSLRDNATDKEFGRVQTVADWVYDRIGQLPEEVALEPSQLSRLAPQMQTGSNSSSPANATHQARGSPSSDDSGSPNSQGASQNAISSQSRAQLPSPAKTLDTDRSSPPVEVTDPLYPLVRAAATIYCRAIRSRVPTSMVSSEQEYHSFWNKVWRIPMVARRGIVGIYIWAVLAIVPNCHNTPTARFVKTLFVNGFLTIAASNWHVAKDATDAALKLQRLLKSSSKSVGLVSGGEKMVQKHGFAVKEVLQNIATVHRPSQEPETESEESDDDELMT